MHVRSQISYLLFTIVHNDFLNFQANIDKEIHKTRKNTRAWTILHKLKANERTFILKLEEQQKDYQKIMVK